MSIAHSELIKWGIRASYLAQRDFAETGDNHNPFTENTDQWREYEVAFDECEMKHNTMMSMEPDYMGEAA